MVSSLVVVVCAPWHAVSSLAKSLLSKYTTLQLKYVQKNAHFLNFRQMKIIEKGHNRFYIMVVKIEFCHEPPFLANIG